MQETVPVALREENGQDAKSACIGQSVEPPPMEACRFVRRRCGRRNGHGWSCSSVRLRRAVGCLGLTLQPQHRTGSPLRPNPSLEPTRSGKAHWPPRAQ